MRLEEEKTQKELETIETKTQNIIQNLSNSLLASAALGLATSLSALSPQVAQAGAVIFNNADPSLASVALGVNGAGHLNFPNPLGFRPVNSGWTGLSYRFPDGTWRMPPPQAVSVKDGVWLSLILLATV